MAHSHSIKEYPRQVAGVMAISAALGALSTMLLTPRRGKEVRSGIKRRGLLMKDRIQRSKEDAIDTGKDMKNEAKRKATKTKDMADEIRRNGEP